jgi:hypothetical protein
LLENLDAKSSTNGVLAKASKLPYKEHNSNLPKHHGFFTLYEATTSIRRRAGWDLKA